jgi:tRNA(fMet)-specific endonuclease VapC
VSGVLLDTNAIVSLFRGDEAVLQALSRADRVYASVVVLGELEAGFRGGARYAVNLELLERFLSKPTVETLPVTRDTSDCFGRIKDALRRKGTPIPINDVWLAAQCLQTGAILVTNDQHFDVVDGIRLWDPPGP